MRSQQRDTANPDTSPVAMRISNAEAAMVDNQSLTYYGI